MSRGTIKVALTGVVAIATAVATCLVFYFSQLVDLHAGIEKNATRIECMQVQQSQMYDTLKEVRHDIKELLKGQ